MIRVGLLLADLSNKQVEKKKMVVVVCEPAKVMVTKLQLSNNTNKTTSRSNYKP